MKTLRIVLLSLLAACSEFEPPAPADSEVLDGPLEGITESEARIFILGDQAFNNEIFHAGNGLGPLFVATSCGSCHPGDGKGHPFTTLTRFGQSDQSGNQFLHLGGPQLQHRALPGFTPEAIPVGATHANFTPPANTGLGFLDAVSDADILAMADSLDNNGDGISGVPNWINIKNYSTERPGTIKRGGKYIGRFGKKASVYDLLQQTANAYNQDIGITTSYEPVDTYSGTPIEPELSDATVQNVVTYLRLLKAPVSRNNPNTVYSIPVFEQVQCDRCHKPKLMTGSSPIAALSNKTFYPYTDLLLHDMGPDLDDGYTEGSAKSSEWRTPPLWGLGLSKRSQGGEVYLMHDGRARSIEAAILMHDGEAAQSRDLFNALTADQKKTLIEFLENL